MTQAGCTGTNCWAHLEWHCEHAGVCRVFNGTDKFGDPYCYALPFVVRARFAEPDQSGKKGLVEYLAVLVPPSVCQYRAMRTAMVREGWGVLSTRMRDREKRTIEIGKRNWQPQRNE